MRSDASRSLRIRQGRPSSDYYGLLDADAYAQALAAVDRDTHRYFCQADELFQVDGRTYVLTNQWNTSVEPVVKALIALMGTPTTVSYSKVLVD